MSADRYRPSRMGNQRNARGVPYREDMGALAPGAGITAGSGTLYKSWVRRGEGGIIVTDILMDLTGLSSSTTDLDIIGTAGVCHIGQITTAKNGIILAGTMTCFEVPAGGADDIDLYSATVGTGAYDAGIAALVETAVVTSAAAWTNGRVLPIIADTIPANNYLYLCGGEAGTAAAYTAGRFLITLHGYAA